MKMSCRYETEVVETLTAKVCWTLQSPLTVTYFLQYRPYSSIFRRNAIKRFDLSHIWKVIKLHTFVAVGLWCTSDCAHAFLRQFSQRTKT